MVLQNAEMRDSVDLRGRTRCDDRRSEGNFVLRQVWEYMMPHEGVPCITLFEDNQGAIQMAQNPITNSSSKHIRVRYHFTREIVARQEIKIKRVSTEEQHADFLTKALPTSIFGTIGISS